MDLKSAEQAAGELFAQGRFQKAATIYQQMKRLLPERLDLQSRLGYLALLANDLDAAIDQLSKAINQGLRSRQTLAHLAEAYYRQGRLDSAAYCYQRLGREGLAGTLAVMGTLDAYQVVQANTSVEIPWLTDNPLPVIASRVNGLNANLVLDTGAGDTVLDTRFAVDAGVRLGGQEQRTFAGGMPAQVTYGHVEELLLNGLGVHHIPVQVIDIPHGLGDWFPDMPIHGILGTGVFSRFRTSLDYRRGSLRLERYGNTSETRPDSGQHDRPGAALWLAENQLLLTCVDLPTLEQGIWFLDSGMTGGAFAVPGTRVKPLRLEVDESDVLVGTGGGGTVHGHKLRVEWLRLDALCRDKLDGVVLDSFPVGHRCGFAIQGLIGHDLLHDSILTLDFPTMQLFLTTENT
jgi:hypothetical protein